MIFKPAARYPADPRAVFILALSVFSGLTALAVKAAPESLESLIPYWGVVLWGVLLSMGSLITLVGMARQTVNGIITEQVGSVMVGVTTIFYSVLALYTSSLDAIQTVGIVLAWGLACLIRWGQLQSLIHDAVRRQEKIIVLDRLYAEIEDREMSARARESARAAARRAVDGPA